MWVMDRSGLTVLQELPILICHPDFRTTESRLVISVAHLLKWQFQLESLNELWEKFKGSSWQHSIIEQRYQINKLLKANPSLKSSLSGVIVSVYSDALEIAIDEMGLPQSAFPENCPYTVEQLLDKAFYPNGSF